MHKDTWVPAIISLVRYILVALTSPPDVLQGRCAGDSPGSASPGVVALPMGLPAGGAAARPPGPGQSRIFAKNSGLEGGVSWPY